MFFKSGNGTIAAISGRQNAGGSDAYGALDDNRVTQILSAGANQSDVYVFSVSTDTRTVGLPGIDTAGNLTSLDKNVIMYDGTTWSNYGQFTGLKGDKGDQGIRGEQGVTGPYGKGLKLDLQDDLTDLIVTSTNNNSN